MQPAPRPPVVHVRGGRGSGKTTLAEALVAALVERGYRVGAVKHSHHAAPPDTEGSDSARLAAAGAGVVAFAGWDATVVRHAHPLDFDEAVEAAGRDADVVVVEGFRDARGDVEVVLTGAPDRRATVSSPGCADVSLAADDPDAVVAAVVARLPAAGEGAPRR